MVQPRVKRHSLKLMPTLSRLDRVFYKRQLLRFVRGLYKHRLELLLPLLPPEWEREIRGG